MTRVINMLINGSCNVNDKSTCYNDQQYVVIDRPQLAKYINAALEQPDLDKLKKQINELKLVLRACDRVSVLEDGRDSYLKYRPLMGEVQQILDAYTLERARYYAERLRKGLSEVKTNGINDINLRRWKDYEGVFTDSLWNIERRDGSGAHLGWYWGNYIPQIPHQLMMRYSKQGDLVVDPFVGSGTTLIECRRLGRHGLGVEINPETVEHARKAVGTETNRYGVTTRVAVGDSKVFDFRAAVKDLGYEAVDLYLMHPPYHDIIRFSDDKNDLSNAVGIGNFLEMFGQVLDNTLPLLKKDRYVGIVIGDKYSQGEWVPLGFYCMQEVMDRGLSLKSIVVKNFDETKGKRNQQALWRYRALLGGFYVFKHEYILIFRKT